MHLLGTQELKLNKTENEDCLMIVDLDGYITHLSPQGSHILGFIPEFFSTHRISIDALVHRDQVHLIYAYLAELLTQKVDTKVFTFNAITNFGRYGTILSV